MSYIDSYLAGKISLKRARKPSTKALLKAGTLTRDEARTMAFEQMKEKPLSSKEWIKEGIITLEEAKPFVLAHLQKNPAWAPNYFKPGLITLEEARQFTFKDIAKASWRVDRAVKLGIITPEEARPFALKHLNKTWYHDSWLQLGIITQEESRVGARLLALKWLEKNPSYDNFKYYWEIGILTRSEAKAFGINVPEFKNPVLNQMDRAGVDVESMIDPDLKFLLEYEG